MLSPSAAVLPTDCATERPPRRWSDGAVVLYQRTEPSEPEPTSSTESVERPSRLPQNETPIVELPTSPLACTPTTIKALSVPTGNGAVQLLLPSNVDISGLENGTTLPQGLVLSGANINVRNETNIHIGPYFRNLRTGKKKMCLLLCCFCFTPALIAMVVVMFFFLIK